MWVIELLDVSTAASGLQISCPLSMKSQSANCIIGTPTTFSQTQSGRSKVAMPG